MGAKPPPEPVKSIDFRGFQASTGAEPHPGKRKKIKPPPGQIPEYAPDSPPLNKPLAMLILCCNSIFQHDFNFFVFENSVISTIIISCNVLYCIY